MQRRGRVLAVATLAALLLAAGWTLRGRDGPRSHPAATREASAPPLTSASDASTVPIASTRRVSAPRAADRTELAALHDRWARSSLQGTQPDGTIRLDATGALVIDAGLRRRFDHFLTLIGEFTAAELQALLADDVLHVYGAAVAAQVTDAFARYLGLREALSAAPLPTERDARHAAIQALRREWFGADAEALFGAEADYDTYTIARLALRDDATLDPEQRERRLRALERTRPRAETRAREDATSALLAEEQSLQFEALGVDAATRHAERSELWGPDAADRLAALDRERSRWQQRVADYTLARQQLLQDRTLDPTQRASRLNQLLQRSFDPNERLRIEALGTIGALPPSG